MRKPQPADTNGPVEHLIGSESKDFPFDVPCRGHHVICTSIPIFPEHGDRERSTHHLVMGAEDEAAAVAAVQRRYETASGPTKYRERWSVEGCYRMCLRDDGTIVFKL